MSPRALLIPVGLVVAVFVAGAAMAQQPADPPACTTAQSHKILPWHLAVSEKVAAGRAARVVISEGSSAALESGLKDADATVRAGSVIADGPDDQGQWFVSIGSKSTKVTVSWTDQEDSPTNPEPCRHTETRTVTSIRGTPPQLTRTPYGTDDSAEFQVRPAGACQTTATGALTFTVTGLGQTRRAVLEDQCGKWRSTKVKTPLGWRIQLLTGDGPASATLRVSLPGHRNVKRTFTYRVIYHGKTLVSGRLRGAQSYSPGVRVWQKDIDEFINYCINKSRPTRSEGGRLYCVRPATSQVFWDFV